MGNVTQPSEVRCRGLVGMSLQGSIAIVMCAECKGYGVWPVDTRVNEPGGDECDRVGLRAELAAVRMMRSVAVSASAMRCSGRGVAAVRMVRSVAVAAAMARVDRSRRIGDTGVPGRIEAGACVVGAGVQSEGREGEEHRRLVRAWSGALAVLG